MKVLVIKYFFIQVPGICYSKCSNRWTKLFSCYPLLQKPNGEILKNQSYLILIHLEIFSSKPLNGLLHLLCTPEFWVPSEANKQEHELFTYFKLGKMGETLKRLVSSGEGDEISYWLLLKPVHISQAFPLTTPSLPHPHNLPIYASNLEK